MSNTPFINEVKEFVFEKLEEQFKEEFMTNIDRDWTIDEYNNFRDEFTYERTNKYDYSPQEYFDYYDGELMENYHSIIKYINERYNELSGEDIDVEILISTEKTFAHLLCFIGDEWNYEGQINDEDELEETQKRIYVEFALKQQETLEKEQKKLEEDNGEIKWKIDKIIDLGYSEETLENFEKIKKMNNKELDEYIEKLKAECKIVWSDDEDDDDDGESEVMKAINKYNEEMKELDELEKQQKEKISQYKNMCIYFELQDGEKEIVNLSNWILEDGTGNDEMFFDECEEPCFVDRELERYVCLEYIENNLVK